MSWLKVALGLISTAVGTEAGREVISNVRSAILKDPPSGEPPPQGLNMETVHSLIAKHREEVDRNLESVVQMLNDRNRRLEEIVRRQRIWNIGLAAAVVIAVIIALLGR
jgi:hypothetical protein